MLDYQRAFIELALSHNVLRFGEFTLKSGRRSPYFFNAGNFASGSGLAGLGRTYAATIAERGIAAEVIFGPAYKGIPIAAVTAAQLAEQQSIDLPWAFNRKETKDHGEGGLLVGAPLAGRVLLVDDVITSGKAIGEVLPLIEAAGATLSDIVVALDRQERGSDQLSAIDEVQQRTGAKVHPIVTLDQVIEYLRHSGEYAEALVAVERYRAEHGA